MSRQITPAAPDLAVFDRAIEVLTSGQLGANYICWALRHAANGSIWSQQCEYEVQLNLWVEARPQGRPWWWSVDAGRHKRARLRVLKAFRQACINAAA